MNKLLLDCLHQDPARLSASGIASLGKDQCNSLFHLAVEHRVVPLLHHRMNMAKELDLPAGLLDKAGDYARQVAINNLRFFDELKRFLNLLHHEKIPVILLKGAWLANEVYDGIGHREMNDIDMLFRKEHLAEAYRIISEMGYTADKPVHINVEVQKNHHLPPVLKKGVAMFELHWNITRPGRSYSIAPEGLWERSRETSVTGITARVLSPEDQLLHLCLHASYQHMFSFGLRPFCDIAAAIEHFGDNINWKTFTGRACEYGWENGIWLTFRMSCDMLDAKVPSEVLDQLQPVERNSSELRALWETGEVHLFTEKTVSASISPKMAAIVKEKGLVRKLKKGCKQVFLPRHIMVTMYPALRNSRWHYMFYLVRLWHLTRLHGTNLIRILLGNKKLTGVVNRKIILDAWLNT